MHNSISIPVEVSCCNGTSLIEKGTIPKPSFVKLDIEGFEYKVLERLKPFFKTSSDIKVVFEHEPYRLNDRKQKRGSVVKLLQSLGFKLYTTTSDGSLAEFNEVMLGYHCNIAAHK